MNPDLFIGVVTYPGTRFPESSGPKGLAHSLAGALEAHGQTCVVEVHGHDAYEPGLLLIDRAEISKSIKAELATERAWRRHVSGTAFHPISDLKLRIHALVRRRKYLDAKSAAETPESAGFRMVRRLVNIEIAHLELMRNAVNSNAGWTLIVEDDATIDSSILSIDDLARAFVEVFGSTGVEALADFVNISRSHTEEELGIQNIFVNRIDWAPRALPEVHAKVAERPVTNTVCAILYRNQFLIELLAELKRIPLSPVLPIDWKLNQALMNMTERDQSQAIRCWSLFPAPIIQGSMHGDSEAGS